MNLLSNHWPSIPWKRERVYVCRDVGHDQIDCGSSAPTINPPFSLRYPQLLIGHQWPASHRRRGVFDYEPSAERVMPESPRS